MAAQAISTPYRNTHIRCDIDTMVKTESARAISRSKHEMAALGLPDTNGDNVPDSYNVEQLPTGAIQIRPYHANLNNPNELNPSAIANSAFQLADMQTAPFITSRPIFRTPDLPGISPQNPDVQSSGDTFFQKGVAANDQWTGNDLSADRQAYGNPQNTNFPIERHAVTVDQMPANKEVAIRFMLPGTSLHVPKVACIFYFGSAVDQTGHGAYAMIFTVDGMVYLQDFVGAGINGADGSGGSGSSGFPGADIIPDSVNVARWRFATQHRTAALAIFMRVIPHLDIGGGGYIAFIQDSQNPGGQGSGVAGIIARGAEAAINAMTFHIHRIVNSTTVLQSSPSQIVTTPQPVGTGVLQLPRTDITGPEHVRLDVPADQRVSWQILQAKYPTYGYFIDAIIDVPFCTITADFTLSWQGIYPNDSCYIVGSVYDATTGMQLTETSAGPTFSTWTPNVGVNHYYVRFDFTGDVIHTPTLWSYSLLRQANVNADSPGEFVIPDDFDAAVVTNYSITGPEQDITHETATSTIQDPADEIDVLSTRSIIQAIIETEYDPLDSSKRSVLIQGEMTRTDGMLWGGQRPSGTLFPAPTAFKYESQWSGMWGKLARAQTLDRILLTGDPANNGGPYRVTDIVTYLLANELGSSSVWVPYSPVRFFPAQGGSDDLQIEPNTFILDAVQHYLWEYLSWFLIWDANATTGGTTQGIVRALPPSLPLYGGGANAYKNLANFLLDVPGTGVAMRPESYGSGQTNWVGTDVDVVQCPIYRLSFKSFVKPPEANCVVVTGTGQIIPSANGNNKLTQWAFNSKSYNPFVDAMGNTVETQDRDSADFIGYCWPVVVNRKDLYNQALVDQACRRIYDQTCHATDMCSFEAPLVLATDSTDGVQNQPRPLRYYDPVTLTRDSVQEQWIVRNCNISPLRGKDVHQKMTLELQRPIITGTIGQVPFL
jgi:hypothetical protein